MQGKRHSPSDEDRRLVKTLSAVGVRYVDIADKLQIDHDTLTKHYKQLKTRAGWREHNVVEHANSEGEPLKMAVTWASEKS